MKKKKPLPQQSHYTINRAFSPIQKIIFISLQQLPQPVRFQENLYQDGIQCFNSLRRPGFAKTNLPNTPSVAATNQEGPGHRIPLLSKVEAPFRSNEADFKTGIYIRLHEFLSV